MTAPNTPTPQAPERIFVHPDAVGNFDPRQNDDPPLPGCIEYVRARPAPVGGVEGASAGPWTYHPGEDNVSGEEANDPEVAGTVRDADRWHVARIWVVGDGKGDADLEKSHANGRLIASLGALSRLSPEPVVAEKPFDLSVSLGDGADRLCLALYGRRAEPRDYLGGSNAKMLHDAAARLSAPLPDAWKGDVERLRIGANAVDLLVPDSSLNEKCKRAIDRIESALKSTHRRAVGLEAERDRLREALEQVQKMTPAHDAVNHCATQALSHKETPNAPE